MRKGLVRSSAVAGIATVVALVVSSGSQALAVPTESRRQITELEIVNATGEDLDLKAFISNDADRGSVVSEERSGVPGLPKEEFSLQYGRMNSYAVDFVGDLEVGRGIVEFNNFLNLQASSVKNSMTSQTAVTHGDKIFTGNEPKIPVEATSSADQDYSFVAEKQDNPKDGFSKKYRLTIKKNFSQKNEETAVDGFSIKRITGEAARAPIYKVTVGEVRKKYDSFPSEVDVDPIVVRGATPNTAFAKLGDVIPVGKPTVDHAEKTVIIPKTSFMVENLQGLTQIQVALQSGHSWMSNLQMLPAPPAHLQQSAVTSMGLQSSTGSPVTANGVSQEALKLKLQAHGETVNPDHGPELNDLYDYVYFRDSAGNLVDGFYKPSAEGGYTSMSTSRGGYVNEMQMAATAENRIYLSTTKPEDTTLRAHLDVSKSQQSPELRVEQSDPTEAVTGTVTGGVSLSDGIVSPADGAAFHHFNGEKPQGAIVTRYLASSGNFPIKVPYYGLFNVRNMDSVAFLNDTDLKDATSVESRFVSGSGTWVSAAVSE
ncbi:hypothetical protein [Streptomyces cyaneofuscatus]|uniref:hypothetical protein n=1 Tax=Streptomyces cyaneofuscatus TaxID=66883 RepID=UPI00381B33C8